MLLLRFGGIFASLFRENFAISRPWHCVRWCAARCRRPWATAAGSAPSGGSGHAGETETSMVMAMRPELVRTDQLDEDGEREGMRAPGAASYYRFDQRTRPGGVGDPRPATAEKGEALLDASADEVAETVRQIRALKPFG